MQIGQNKGKIVKLTKNKDQLFSEEEMSLPLASTWPLGTQGALVVANGETVQIIAGSTLDYSSIDIQAGGVLEIVGTIAGPITYIGCTGDITINGELRARNYLGNTETVSGTIKGENLSFTLNQALGGAGGRTAISLNIAGPAPGLNGFGAGGAGGAANAPSIPNGGTVGGAGGSGGSSGSPGSDKASGFSGGAVTVGSGGGGNITLGNGGNGINGGPIPFPSIATAGPGGVGGGSGGGGGSTARRYSSSGLTGAGAGGGGGGGGYKGKHGLPIFIYGLGSISGLGSINLSGSNGFNGGNGGSGATSGSGSATPGGGGGGGAGGSGGFLWVRYGISFSVPYSLSGGTGGTAGIGGDSQTAGPSGINGDVDIKQIL